MKFNRQVLPIGVIVAGVLVAWSGLLTAPSASALATISANSLSASGCQGCATQECSINPERCKSNGGTKCITSSVTNEQGVVHHYCQTEICTERN